MLIKYYVGDKFHSMMICPDKEVQMIRSEALCAIIKVVPQLEVLPIKENLLYICSCCNSSVTNIVPPFIVKYFRYVDKYVWSIYFVLHHGHS